MHRVNLDFAIPTPLNTASIPSSGNDALSSLTTFSIKLSSSMLGLSHGPEEYTSCAESNARPSLVLLREALLAKPIFEEDESLR